MVMYPAAIAAASAPRTSSLKNGLAMSGTTMPMVLVRPVTIETATWLGR